MSEVFDITLFDIRGLLIFTILFLLFLTLIPVIWKKNSYSKREYFILMIILSFFSYFTSQNYIFPDENIYSNDDYHVFEHLGYEIKKNCYLTESEYPEISIWDDKTGSIKLERDSNTIKTTIEYFFEPFYYNQNGIDVDKYILANNYLPHDYSKGFGIILEQDTLMELHIRKDIEKDKINYLVKYDHFNSTSFYDTCDFHKTLFQGYPLLDLLLKAPNADKISDKLRDIIVNSYLVRDNIKIRRVEKGGGICTIIDTEDSADLSELRFFPSGFILSKANIKLYNFADNIINIQDVNFAETFIISLSNKSLIYAGLGFNKTDEYFLELNNVDVNIFNLRYILPIMHKLKNGKDDINLFITSDNEEVVRNELDGGYFFDVFDNPDNKNHINATLSYFTGDAKTSMFFKVKDLNKFKDEADIFPSNQSIKLHTKNKKLNWLIRFNDLRNSNLLQPYHIFWLLFVFISFLFIRLFIVDGENSQIKLTEAGIYLAFYTFLVIRMIISWRVSTFVPIEDISASMFYTLRDIFSFYKDLLVIVIVFWVVVIFKLLGPVLWRKWHWLKTKNWIKEFLTKHKNKFNTKTKQLIAFGIIVSFYIILGVLVYFAISERFAYILWPIILFFLGDYFLAIIIRDKYKSCSGLSIFNIGSWQWERLILWSLVLTFLFWKDSGFGIVFLLYSVVYYFLLAFLIDEIGKAKGRSISNTITVLLISIIPLILIMLILHFQNFFILKIFNNTEFFIYGLVFVILIFNYFILKSRSIKWLKHLFIFGSIVVISLLFTFQTEIQNGLNNKYKYIKYRVEIQNNDVEDLIIKNDFNSSDITYILRSAQNQWFINIYQNAKSGNYFKLQPHFGQGSTYTTQTTDLVILRYIIAEHPQIIVFLLLGIFIMLIALFALSEDITTIANKNALGVLILLFTIAFFIWLTSTNRFTFFGQDYPFLSITSRLAFVFPIFLFIYVIILSWSKSDKRENPIPVNRSTSYNYLIPMFISAMVIAGIVLLSIKGNENDQNTFSLADSDLNKEIASNTNKINNEFKDYQLKNIRDNQTLSIDSIIKKFVASPNYTTFNRLMCDTANNHFYSSLLRRFLLKTTNKWDPKEMIHIRKRGEIYGIANNSKYYSVKSPFEETNSWEGNLLAAPVDKNAGFIEAINKEIFKPSCENNKIIPNVFATIESSRNNEQIRNYYDKMLNIYLMRIPAIWSPDSIPIFLMYKDYGISEVNQAKFTIYNDKTIIDNNKSNLTVKIFPQDVISFYYKDEKKQNKKAFQWKFFIENDKYLAKNIWLNGNQRFFYPIGKEFNWSYSYTQILKEVLNSKTMKKQNHITSIDYNLTSNIFKIIHEENFPSHSINKEARSILARFRNLSFDEQRNINNNTQIFYSESRLQFVEDSKYEKNKKLCDIIRKINNDYNRYTKAKKEHEYNAQLLNEIIDGHIESKFDYSVVVLDGYGRIRQLFDYNKLVKVNPNNIEEYSNYIHNLYRQSNNATERDFFGNKSLLAMSPGAGSSLKPVVYSAVVSQYNLNWQNINIATFNRLDLITTVDEKDEKSSPKLAWYGGKHFYKEKGNSLWNLDKHNYSDLGLKNKWYLTKSNNLYHSLVLFLGSYSKKQISTIRFPNSSSLLRKVTQENINKPEVFPIIQINQLKYCINPDEWPSEVPNTTSYFSKNESILAVGLNTNFNWITNVTHWENKDNYQAAYDDGIYLTVFDSAKTKSNYFYWCYPEYPFFFQSDRKAIPNFRTGIVQPTLGAFPIKVTPFKMSEMAMRMITFNRYENITSLNPERKELSDYEFFDFDENSWSNTSNYINWMQINVFSQMNKVLKPGGTMSYLNDNLRQYRNMGYYFYAKTGTISDESNKFERGKHLLVIITNQKLHDPIVNPLSIEKLRNLKYYIVYMSYHDIRTKRNGNLPKDYNPENYFKVIDAVMKSELFNKYMDQGL